jgi:hypothetical protein
LRIFQKIMVLKYRQAGEDLRSTKTYRSKSAIWVMDAGPTITSLPRSKHDNIDHQK